MQRPQQGVALTRAQLKLSGDFLIVPGILWMLTEENLQAMQLNGLYVSKNHTEGPESAQWPLYRLYSIDQVPRNGC